MKTIQESTERYVPPKAKVVKISTRAHILQSSIGGTPGLPACQKDLSAAGIYRNIQSPYFDGSRRLPLLRPDAESQMIHRLDMTRPAFHRTGWRG